MKTSRLIIALIALVAIVGCSKEEKKPVRKANSAKFNPANIGTYKARDVLIQVGTNRFTKGDLDALVELRMRIYRAHMPQGAKKINLAAVQNPLLADAPSAFRAQVALAAWAETNGIAVSQDLLDEKGKALLTNLRVRGSLESYVAGEKREFSNVVRRQVMNEALTETVRADFLKQHPITVTPAEAQKFIAWVQDANREANATNALVWAHATNLWNQIKSEKPDFCEFAAQHTEDPSGEDGVRLGAVRLTSYAEEPQALKAIRELGVGETSAPVESDNGLVLLHLLAVVDKYGKPTTDRLNPETCFELAQIYLRLGVVYDTCNEKQALEEMRKDREAKMFSDFVGGLVEKDGAVFPHGQEVFRLAGEKLKMPMMLYQ